MTTNIKALATRIKELSEKGDWTFYEIQELTKLQGQVHVIASALLRVLEDAERLAAHVGVTADIIALGGTPKREDAKKVFDAHTKLMEEFGGE